MLHNFKILNIFALYFSGLCNCCQLKHRNNTIDNDCERIPCQVALLKNVLGDSNLQAISYLQIDINVLIGLASCVDYGSFSQTVFATRTAG